MDWLIFHTRFLINVELCDIIKKYIKFYSHITKLMPIHWENWLIFNIFDHKELILSTYNLIELHNVCDRFGLQR
ncbi:MAG: hypothetical protein QG646_652 [Euryarchaeota archaeon]|nr:hypothetical protein [Euryarchaeota archaeon]